MRPRTDACTIAREAGKQNLGAFPEREEGEVGKWDYGVGKSGEGSKKRILRDRACMKGHPGQQYVIWEQLKSKPLQIVVSKSFRTKP